MIFFTKFFNLMETNDLDVKKIRESLGMTQEKFAEILGVHTRTVQNWESGSTIPESKRTILRDVAEQRHYGGGEQHNVNGDNIMTVNGTIHADSLVELLIQKERSLQESQIQITKLLNIIDNLTTK